MKNQSIVSQTAYKFFGQDKLATSITVTTYLKITLSNSKNVNSKSMKYVTQNLRYLLANETLLFASVDRHLQILACKSDNDTKV